MLIISKTDKKGIGKELKLKTGDAITHFDGHEAVDVLDYLFYDERESFTMTVKKANGRTLDFDVEKTDDETLGLEFSDDGLSIRTCRNDCIFCFVSQMPKGLRNTLYVKDDDYRQSFLCGNFVTLTNLDDKDVERILRLNLSPLYISVQAMNGELRKKMLNNRFADKIGEYVKTFSAHGIIMHTQVVLVENVNDKKELDFTARELYKFYPYVQSLAVVPCGITKYRDGLTEIGDITKEYAISVIEQADKLNGEFGVNFVTLADEFYLKAERELKPYDYYGEFPQIENGVGGITKLVKEFDESLEYRTYNKKFLSVTGVSAYPVIKKLALKTEEYCKGVSVDVLAVENGFFGQTVTCSGLLVGRDIINAVKSYNKEYDELVLPSNTLRETEDVFLDGITLDELSATIGKPVRVSRGGGKGFYDVFSLDYFKENENE